ncbi:MAG: chemotaxis protein CheW [Coriobacteriia bacterium]|nr:chemotaxis protein CheW [Coriobacteriia bacterium]
MDDNTSQTTASEESALSATAEEILRRRAASLAQEAESEEATDMMGILLFRLAEEWYAVRVEDVREIYQEYLVTPIPCVPDFIHGVVNIRGEIISVTDIAMVMRLGRVSTETDMPPAIVIQNDECATAIVVDEIGDIADVPAGGIEPPLSTIDKVQAEFIAGSLHVDSKLVGLLNIERVLQPIGVTD